MKKDMTVQNLIKIIAGALFSIIFVCLIVFTLSYSKAAPAKIEYNASIGIEYFVSGQYVEYDENTHQYSVTKNSPVTIAVINNNMICEPVNNVIMTVTDGTNTYTSNKQMITFNATTDKTYTVTANTRAISKVDHGSSLSDPYVIKSFTEFEVLYKVLADLHLTDYEEEIHQSIFDGAQANKLRISYIKLFDNIIVDMNEFYGLKDFQGVFDFNGYNLTLNIINKEYTIATHGDNQNQICAGLFSTVSNSTNAPCVIRNGQLRGSISLTPDVPDDSGKIFVGGVAGKSSGVVFTNNLKSSVSISVDDSTSIYLGGFFGATSSPMDKHNNVSYNGVHSILSATSNGANAITYVGGYAGTIDNTYVTGYTDESNYLTIISNSLNSVSGGAVAGGFAGAIDHQSGNLTEISIDNILFKTKGELSVSASVNNGANNANQSCYAVAGGVFGVSYCNGTNNKENRKITHGLVQFVEGNSTGNNLKIDIFATNQSTSSQGNVFAGGLYGHVSGSNYYKYIPTEPIVIFDADVIIKAEQNGHDIARAGGMFGFGAFSKETNDKLSIVLTSKEGSIDVKAEQTSISKKEDTTNPKEVSAGYYTSVLPSNYSINNVDFTINNGKLLAQRNVGSTIFGAVYAGGFAGSAIGTDNKAKLNDINIYLNDSSVAGYCLSFDSNLNDDKNGHVYSGYEANVASAGFIGYIKNYGSVSYTGSNNNMRFNNFTSGIENISVYVDLSSSQEYVIRSIQNAVSANSDHCSEGYAGGINGLCDSVIFKNIRFEGDSSFDTIINLSCTNSPNTASCGGLIGENVRENHFAVDGGIISNAEVILDAYFKGAENNQLNYDAYCGGAFGVIAASGNNRNHIVQNIDVINTNVSCIGENTMLSIAGGIAGGIWWSETILMKNCKVIDSSVYASSMGFKFYAGGVAGMAQASFVGFDNIYVIDTVVDGYSSNQSGKVAGVCAYKKTDLDTRNTYSNAKLSGTTTGTLNLYPINDSDNGGTLSNNYFDPFKIQGSISQTNVVNSTNNKNVAIGTGTGINNMVSSLTITHTNNFTVYPNASTNSLFSVEYEGDVSCLSDSDGFQIKANNASGTVYANLYLNVDGEKRLFASSPIYIRNGNTNTNFEVIDVDNNAVINPINNDYYIKVDVNSNEYQNLMIDFETSSPVINLYNPTYSNQTTNQNIIADLKNKCITTTTLNAFNNKVDIIFNDENIILSANENMLTRTVVAIKIGSSYVFVDYIPNYVDYISIEPSSSTPALGVDNNGNHIFAPGDNIIMDGYEYDKNGNVKLSNVINFSSNVSGYNPPVTVYSNGRIDISTNATNGYTFTITGTYNGNLSDGSVESVTYKIIVYNEVNISTHIVGGTFTAQRKAITKQPYTFVVNPNPGFGLSPDMVSITINGTQYILESDVREGLDVTYISSIIGIRPTQTMEDVEVTVNNVKFIVSYSSITGGYTITIPGESVTGAISIEFIYSLTADIIFDFGLAYASKGNDRYYLYTVKTGTVLNQELFDEFKDNIDVSVFGFNHRGYYLTDSATSLESFGDELNDILNEHKVINGPIYFYARWTYEVLIEYPDGVTVESTLPVGLLESTTGGEIKLVPISTNSAFTFKIVPDADYEGMPKFFVFIYKEDGSFVDITSKCIKNEFGGYEVDNSFVDGIIFVKVANESFVFNDGEVESHESLDTTIYGDSVFTLEYNINYTNAGISKDNAVLGNEIQIEFEKALPANTSIRLYRSYNSVAKDTYQYVLSSSSSIINLSDFINLKDGKTLVNTDIINPIIFNEEYYLIITLPNNQSVTTFISNNSAMFNSTHVDSSNTNIDEYLSQEYKGKITERPNYYEYGLAKVEFDVLQTLLVSVTEQSGRLTVTFENNQVIDGKIEEDLRHNDKYYVWEIYNPNGINVTTTNNIFGTNNFITNTLSATYYLANGSTNSITSLTGCTIRLLEVTNTLSPASGVVLYSKTL